MAYISIITLDETFISLAAKLIHYSSALGGYRWKYHLFKKDGLRNKWDWEPSYIWAAGNIHLPATRASILFSRCASWSSRRPWIVSFSQRMSVGTPVSLNLESTLHGCWGFLHVGLSPTKALKSATSSAPVSSFL